MRYSRILVSLGGLFLFLCLTGAALAAASYDHTAPGRPTDAEIESEVVNALTKEDAGKAGLIKVYSFQGHVFLVGEPDAAFGLYAEKAAHYAQASHFVTAHWFPANTANPNSDPAVKSATISRLGSVMQSPNYVVVEVWGGNIVLLGVVQKPEDIAQAEALVKAVPGMKSFRSYLMTSQQALKAIGNPSDLYQK